MYSLSKILSFDRREFYRNPHPNFDVPPPNFEETDDNGWTTLAKAIVTKESGLRKYVDYAKRWKEKETEWKASYAKYVTHVSSFYTYISLLDCFINVLYSLFSSL